MKTKPHIIHRVNLEIAVDDPQVATQVQEDALRMLKNDILPDLEKFLDGLETGEKSLRFENLDLNLGSITPEDFANEFISQTARRFREQIWQAISPSSASTEKEIEPAVEKLPEERQTAMFLYFLETGRLPWWAAHGEFEDVESLTMDTELLLQEPFRSRLISLLRTNPTALERLILQFQEEFVLKLVLSVLQGHTLAHSALKRILEDKNLSETSLQAFVQQALEDFTFKSAGITKKALQHGEIKKPDNEPEKGKGKENEEDGIFVENAGLVLLHPFFEYFFREYDLLNQKAFRNKKSKAVAIHLLHYLATGKESPMEYELLLEKYLCGWPVDEPIPRKITLTGTMKSEAEKLLIAAIGHWKALKKTSAQGLREAFLQRQGKLMLNEFTPRLIVEGNSVDVLLSYLPWGIGIIKLPWLEQALIVEWNH